MFLHLRVGGNPAEKPENEQFSYGINCNLAITNTL
jgi:hypothetical protein